MSYTIHEIMQNFIISIIKLCEKSGMDGYGINNEVRE